MTSAPSLLSTAAEALGQGNTQACHAACAQALTLNASDADALHLDGLAWAMDGDKEQAINQIRHAVTLRPDFAAAWSNLGSLLLDAERLDDAETALRQSILHSPSPFVSPLYNLGNLLRRQGRLIEAEQTYGQALAAQPTHHPSLYSLATVLHERGKDAAALALAQTAQRVAPSHPETAFLVGNLLREQGRLEEALAAYDQALALDPSFAACHTNRGNLLSEQGRAIEALHAYQAALAASPHDHRYASNLLCALQYIDGIAPETLLSAHQSWNQQYGAPEPRPAPFPRADRHGKPLTVGLVSADFGCHPVGWFTIPLAEGADPQQLRVILYSDRVNEDQNTQRLERAVPLRRTGALDDISLAQLIAQDGVDILIDASGHTGHNRLMLFANRAAPLQASWAAYVGTTGVEAMDALIADTLQVPVDDEVLYTEQVLRLPVGYVPYAPPPYAPAVRPRDPGAPLTFGSFNNPVKLSDPVLQAWARLLKAVPHARLLVKFRYLDDLGTANHLRARFAAAGGDIERLDIEGGSPHAEMLGAYHHVDIALDTTPYSGGLTTLEALWMGVPVITCPGRTFASRHSLTHMSHLGLGELCANDWDEYHHKAVALITDAPRLEGYRASLRGRLQAAPLTDGTAFARHFEHALRSLWESDIGKP